MERIFWEEEIITGCDELIFLNLLKKRKAAILFFLFQKILLFKLCLAFFWKRGENKIEDLVSDISFIRKIPAESERRRR